MMSGDLQGAKTLPMAKVTGHTGKAAEGLRCSDVHLCAADAAGCWRFSCEGKSNAIQSGWSRLYGGKTYSVRTHLVTTLLAQTAVRAWQDGYPHEYAQASR